MATGTRWPTDRDLLRRLNAIGNRMHRVILIKSGRRLLGDLATTRPTLGRNGFLGGRPGWGGQHCRLPESVGPLVSLPDCGVIDRRGRYTSIGDNRGADDSMQPTAGCVCRSGPSSINPGRGGGTCRPLHPAGVARLNDAIGAAVDVGEHEPRSARSSKTATPTDSRAAPRSLTLPGGDWPNRARVGAVALVSDGNARRPWKIDHLWPVWQVTTGYGSWMCCHAPPVTALTAVLILIGSGPLLNARPPSVCLLIAEQSLRLHHHAWASACFFVPGSL